MDSSRSEDLILSRADLENYSNDNPDVYWFTQRQICLIMSCLRYAEWETRWIDRDIDNELVQSTIRELCMLNAKHLVKSNLILMAAITGRQIDLSIDAVVENMIDGYWDFSEDGLVPTMGGGSTSYEDELQDIVENVATIAVQLGAV